MPGPSCVIAASEGSDIVGANRHRLPWTMSLFWVPSFALSLHIEAERPEQNYLSTRAANGLLAASQFVSGFFALESRLCAALHHELVLRGADGPISSTTLRTLDSVLYASVASPDPRSATLDKVSRHGLVHRRKQLTRSSATNTIRELATAMLEIWRTLSRSRAVWHLLVT